MTNTKILDARYPKGDRIRIAPDDLRVHTSQETRRYLATVPGRFEFALAPKHGSWPDTVEGFLGKMTRQMPGGIRVESKEELKERIYKHFEGPTGSRWPAAGSTGSTRWTSRRMSWSTPSR